MVMRFSPRETDRGSHARRTRLCLKPSGPHHIERLTSPPQTDLMTDRALNGVLRFCVTNLQSFFLFPGL
jgi:hypothetical protein